MFIIDKVLVVIGAATIVAYATYLVAYALGVIKGIDVTIYR